MNDRVSSAKNVFIFRKNSGLFKNTNSLSNQDIEFRRAFPSPLPPHDRYCYRVFGYRIYRHGNVLAANQMISGPILYANSCTIDCCVTVVVCTLVICLKRAAKRTLQDKHPHAKNIVGMNHASFHLFPIAIRKALRHYQPTAEWRHTQAPLETKQSATYL